jgi:hypothetical protein
MIDVLYAALAGDASCLAGYTLGPGGLTEPPRRTPLPGPPTDLALSPGGRFLYAEMGCLERIGHQETGPVAWLLAARLG